MAARRNAFNVTLSPEHAASLRARAEELGVAPTTLAARFLADVLDGKDAALLHGEVASVRETLDEVGEGIAAILKETLKTRRDLTNATLKLLAQSGMEPERAKAWVEKYLHPPVEGRPRA